MEENFQKLIKSKYTLNCSICKDVLLPNPFSDNDIVSTVCGHVFHSKCIHEWYAACGQFSCAVCRQMTEEDQTQKLYLENEDDNNYFSVIELVELLQLKNQEQMKQLTVAEIKLILMGSNSEQIFSRFDKIKWHDLTLTFQEDLKRKLESTREYLNMNKVNLCFLSSGTLLQLIASTSNDATVFSKFIDEYFVHQLFMNDYVSLKQFEHIFKWDILSYLRIISNIPSLSLEQLPVSPSIIKMLFHNRVNSDDQDENIIIKIVENHLENISNLRIDELCEMVIVQQMCKELRNKSKLFVPEIDQTKKENLVNAGILKRENQDFVHECVKYYIIGILTSVTVQKVNITVQHCQQIFFEKSKSYALLMRYFTQNLFPIKKFSKYAQNFVRTFTCTAVYNFEGLLVLSIMKCKSVYELVELINCFDKYFKSIRKNIWEIGYPCLMTSFIMILYLPHFAVIRQDLTIFQKLYELFHSTERTQLFDIRQFVHLCASSTLNIDEKDILERKKIISFVFSLDQFKFSLKRNKPLPTPKDVHHELLKFVMDKGQRYFKRIWKVEQI